jgi:cellulose synthase/poly-beta-1,6-N-acetylglucosamine synthase-like glycosyltransferase
MTAVHPFPIKNSNNLTYLLNKIIWQLHHELCLKSPKLGETIAFRNVIDEIPVDCVTDEAYIEASIKSKGYDLCYKEDAFVYSKCPMKLKDLFLQRIRIYWGHIDVKKKYGYKTASMNTLLILRIAVKYIIRRLYLFIPFLVLSILESLARTIAAYRYYFIKEPIPFIWPKYKK